MSIDVMKQALEALDTARPACFADNTIETIDNAITALRAAIEHEEIHTSVFSNTHQQPLTDDEIAEIYIKWDATPGTSMADFARAIEAAHGIGRNK